MFYFKLIYHFQAILKKILFRIVYGKKLMIGNGTTFRKWFSILINDDAKIFIGNNCFFNNYCSLVAHKNIVIGNNTLFGENVKIYDNNHNYKNENLMIKDQGFTSSEIIIGNNCWIASNV